MKKLALIIFLTLMTSCYDSINDMLYDVNTPIIPICVDSASTAVNPDGRGWKNAYKTLYEVLQVGENPNLQDGAEIWIKAGTYTLTQTITIGKSVSVYGGFNGTESRRNQRSVNKNITVINQNGFHIAINSYASGKTILLDGFKITADDPIQAVSVGIASITFNNCKFEGMTYTSSGAAINIASSSITISNCEFNNCSATGFGGAINVIGATLNILNSTFTGNSSASAVGGGAIFLRDSTLNISNSTFTSNHASAGGAILIDIFNGVSIVTISNKTDFTNNYSTGNAGGAIWTQMSAGTGTVTLNIDACTFNTNHSTNTSPGGALYLIAPGSAIITNSTFSGNYASYGGAIAPNNTSLEVTISGCNFNSNKATDTILGGGAIWVSGSNATTIVNSLFYNNNSAHDGGGLYFAAVTLTINLVNLTFYQNTAANNGGGIYISDGRTIYNSVFYNNGASSGASFYGNAGTSYLNCCYNNGTGSGSTSTGNTITSGDPFVSVTYGNSNFLYPT